MQIFITTFQDIVYLCFYLGLCSAFGLAILAVSALWQIEKKKVRNYLFYIAFPVGAIIIIIIVTVTITIDVTVTDTNPVDYEGIDTIKEQVKGTFHEQELQKFRSQEPTSSKELLKHVD